jgi:hypothetical protein
MGEALVIKSEIVSDFYSDHENRLVGVRVNLFVVELHARCARPIEQRSGGETLWVKVTSAFIVVKTWPAVSWTIHDPTHTLALYRVTGLRGEGGLGKIQTQDRSAAN